eukprot:TRINITY_DN2228_c0_g2_i1.p1 TRINITY_DN2228_c0_g2~~TRINITY_DN2228_c0_g2_i1.p1  ORF type:complete len:622 (-),score=178.67 TRINITY_DN2228_c0_g2_i1:66-1931(-)
MSTKNNETNPVLTKSNVNTQTESAYVPPHLRNRSSQTPPARRFDSDRDRDVPRSPSLQSNGSNGSISKGGKWHDSDENNDRSPQQYDSPNSRYDSPRRDRYRKNERWGTEAEKNPFESDEVFDSGTTTGINFDKYDDIPVDASGNDCPPPMEGFADGNLGTLIEENILLAKYAKPTPVQRYAIPIIKGKRDLMACAQTGSGKTAAFLVPVISQLYEEGAPSEQERYNSRSKAKPSLLVLAPTRELAKQIHKEAQKFSYKSGLRSVCVYGGTEFYKQFRELERGCDILVATPGRLVDMIERGKVCLSETRFLTLDEADRMLDMGFEPQIRRIVEQEGMPGLGDRQTMLFSATFPSEIQRLAADFLDDWIFLRVGRVGSTTDFICQKVMYVPDGDKRTTLLELLRTVKGLTLVFVETKKSADFLDNLLYKEGFPSTSIHGDRSQREREDALNHFKSGRMPILVATDVAARGLDIPNVLHVINYDMPNNIDSYIHRIGRTGRAGNSGLATAFVNEDNTNILAEVISNLEETDQECPEWLIDLAKRNRGYSGKGRSYRGGGGGRDRFGGRDYRQERGGAGRDSGRDSGARGGRDGGGKSPSSGRSDYGGYGSYGGAYGGGYGGAY